MYILDRPISTVVYKTKQIWEAIIFIFSPNHMNSHD